MIQISKDIECPTFVMEGNERVVANGQLSSQILYVLPKGDIGDKPSFAFLLQHEIVHQISLKKMMPAIEEALRLEGKKIVSD